MLRKSGYLCAGFLWLFGSAVAHAIEQADLALIGKQLKVTYQILDNASQQDCTTKINGGHCFSARLTFENGPLAIPEQTTVYFSHISPIVSAQPETVSITQVQGDLHSLQFTRGLAAGQKVSATVKAPFWHASRSDVMPNYYLVHPGLAPVLIDSTRRVFDSQNVLSFAAHAGDWQNPEQYRRNAQDNLVLEDSNTLYARYPEHWKDTDLRRAVPQVAKRVETGKLVGLRSLNINASERAKWKPAVDLLASVGLPLSDLGTPVVVAQQPLEGEGDEAYQLSIKEHVIDIKAASPLAVQYALVTLAQLYDAETATLPLTVIEDSPRYAFRGVHLDVARHFLGKDAIEGLLSHMFALKLNTLHLHLSDDEGWRVEIPSLPELTEIGGFRCHDLSETRCLLPQLGTGPFRDAPGNGFLSKADYQRVLRYAAARGIEVIPSFDMPGHARAAVKAMEARHQRLMALGQPEQAREFLLSDPQDTSRYLSVQFYNDNTVNPCLESSYRFIDVLLGDLIQMHKEAGVPLQTYHLGADETAGAWVASPACQTLGKDPEALRSHFVSRVVAMGNARGLRMAGWSDGMEDSLEQLSRADVQVNIWDTLFNKGSQKVAVFEQAGIPTVLSLPDVLYFDFPYRNHPLEPGYYWGSRSTGTRKVFDFMPAHLAKHQFIWQDRMGNPYKDNASVSKKRDVKGIQAQLWTEVTPTQAHMEYMLYPRLIAFAERAWHEAPWASLDVNSEAFFAQRDRDWRSFAQVLGRRILPRLLNEGVNARVPPPGAKLSDGKLYMRAPLPGLDLEYRLDGGQWQTYEKPVTVSRSPQVRTRVKHTGYVSTSGRIALH